MTNTIIGYARISTGDQTLNLQMDALKNAGCTKIFQDQASGVKEKRQGLDAALDYMREGDTLVVWKYDRISRNVKHLLELLHIFKEKNVTFRSITEGIDTSTPIGKMMYTIIAGFAQLEHDTICERIREGVHAARIRGEPTGRPEKLKKEDHPAFKALFLDREVTIEKICKHFNISKTCVYNNARKLGIAATQRKLANTTTIVDVVPDSDDLAL
jgi:DNA invertase Pin-like site-specific DNA recombinase